MRPSKLVASSLLAFSFACASNGVSNDPLSDPTPRAQGTIVLSASHTPGSSVVTPSVSVAFVPDTSAVVSSCGQTTEGACVVTQPPDCSNTKCQVGETCGWDDSCNVACIPGCTLSCGENQTCTKASDGSQSCQPIQTFDAGAIAISGTTMPVTVYPPYAWETTDQGAPFSPGAALHVYASGPTGDAGFASFDEDFKATTLLETTPSLDHLDLSDVFGSSDLSLGWVPGNDRVYIMATGAGGSARCLADDTKGAFSVPRDVLTTVIGSSKIQALSLSIERVRLERHDGLKTVGSLVSQSIQPKAWLDLTTKSIESISLQACTSTQTACGAKCVDTNTDANNCGSCGNSCDGGSCFNGSCQSSSGGTCNSCAASANAGTCVSEYSACTGSCQLLLSCIVACNGNTTCASSCYSTYPTGQSAFNNYYTCLCGTACTTECATQCGV